MAQVLRDTARVFDHVVRYGGDEFSLILPHTDTTQATFAAERLRAATEAMPVLLDGQEVRLTASLGVATFPEDAINARDLLDRADEALYEAKRIRNTVSSFSERNRRFPRAQLNLVMHCTNEDKDGGPGPVPVTAMNVSFGGMLCLSPVAILPGTKVEVVLDPMAEGGRSLCVSAHVVRLERESEDRGFSIALAFDLGSQEERSELVRLVDQNRLD